MWWCRIPCPFNEALATTVASSCSSVRLSSLRPSVIWHRTLLCSDRLQSTPPRTGARRSGQMVEDAFVKKRPIYVLICTPDYSAMPFTVVVYLSAFISLSGNSFLLGFFFRKASSFSCIPLLNTLTNCVLLKSASRCVSPAGVTLLPVYTSFSGDDLRQEWHLVCVWQKLLAADNPVVRHAGA